MAALADELGWLIGAFHRNVSAFAAECRTVDDELRPLYTHIAPGRRAADATEPIGWR